jgi:hypothetical protein
MEETMSRGFRPVLFAVGVLLCWFSASAAAQVKSIPLPNHIDPDSITVIFSADVKQMDGANVSANSVVPPPSIYVKEGGRRIYLTCSAELMGVARLVKLSSFKTLQGDRAVHLVRGSDDGGLA